MALLLPKEQVLYIQVPATGCSVVSKLLRESTEVIELGRKHNSVPELLELGLITEKELDQLLVVANIRNPFDRLVSYYQRLAGDWIEEYFQWADRDLVRKFERGDLNAAELKGRRTRLAKGKVRKRRRAKLVRLVGFNVWVSLTLLRSINPFGRTKPIDKLLFPMLEGVDVVIRQEMLQSGVATLFQKVGLGATSVLNLAEKNRTHGKRRYTDYYSWILQRVFEGSFRRALQRYGYSFSGVIGTQELVVVSDAKKFETHLVEDQSD